MFVLNVRPVITVLVVTGLVLVLCSVAALVAFEVTGVSRVAGVPYLQMLRVDRETNNLPAWYSSGLLLLCACSVACVAASERARHGPLAPQWWLLAGTLAVMSADEEVQLHEHLGVAVSWLTGIDVPWTVPGAAVVIALGILTRGVWRSLDARARRRFVLAGIVYGVGAIGMDVLYKVIGPGRDGVTHFAFIHVEEGLEMVGAALLLRAVWLVIAPQGAVRIGAPEAA